MYDRYRRLRALFESHRLTAAEVDRLLRDLTGSAKDSNRDLPGWMAAHVAAFVLCGLPGSPEQRADLLIKEILSARTRRDVADRYSAPASHGDARRSGSASGPVLEAPNVAFECGWPALVLAFALFYVLVMDVERDDGGSTLREIRGMFIDLADIRSPLEARLRRARLVMTAEMSEFRKRWFPAAEFERRNAHLKRYALERFGGDRRRWAFTDDDVLCVWQASVEQGERPKFKTVAALIVVYTDLLEDDGQAGEIDGAADLSEPVIEARYHEGLRQGRDCDDDSHDHGGEPPDLAAAVDAVPDDPKVLLGVERQMLVGLFGLGIAHRRLPMTILRLTSFGKLQDLLIERVERRRGRFVEALAQGKAEISDYDLQVRRFSDLTDHIKDMAQLAVALRKDDPIEHLLPRRRGFDADRTALRDVFATFDEHLATIVVEMRQLTRACHRLHRRTPLMDRFTADEASFLRAFRTIYGNKGDIL